MPFENDSRLDWFQSSDVRPYVFVRPENHIKNPGALHNLDWFSHHKTLYKDPLNLKELEFAEQIYHLESLAFASSNMAMPRWVFYDCAVMPGFVAGFAWRTSALPPKIKEKMRAAGYHLTEWIPLSLFIIIPTMKEGEWVAHNLCSVNSLLDREDQIYGLGFLSKAFGLWYANVKECSGMTQWGSPALRLHSHFGHLEVIGAYAPVHTYAKTVTYRAQVDVECWKKFFTKEEDLEFLKKYKSAGFSLDPQNEQDMISLQKKIQEGEGRYFLNANEIAQKKLTDKLDIYTPTK